MKSPAARPTPATPAMFVESLVTTFPARRRLRGAMIAAVGVHLLAGTALYASGLVRFDPLERPVIALRAPPSIDVLLQPKERHAARKGTEDAKGGGKPRDGKEHQPPEAPKVPPAIQKNLPKEPGTEPPPAAPQTGEETGDPRDGVGKYNENGTRPGDVGTQNGTGTENTGSDPITAISRDYALSEPPVVKSRVEPVYPEMARQQGMSGVVILEIVIDEQGRVIATRIMRTDNVIFNRSAEDAVRQWKFSSPKNDGRAVRTYKTVTVYFQLH